MAVSPFREPFLRLKYRHSGQKLPNAQVVRLPLGMLQKHQTGNLQNDLKSLPPGFDEIVSLNLGVAKL